jgi:hypothetical protein
MATNMSIDELKKQSLDKKLSPKQKQQLTSMLVWVVDHHPEKANLFLSKFGHILTPTTLKSLREKMKAYNHPWFKKWRDNHKLNVDALKKGSVEYTSEAKEYIKKIKSKQKNAR